MYGTPRMHRRPRTHFTGQSETVQAGIVLNVRGPAGDSARTLRAPARLAPCAQVVDERAQRTRGVAPLRIIQVVARERLAELLEDAHQLPAREGVAHMG